MRSDKQRWLQAQALSDADLLHLRDRSLLNSPIAAWSPLKTKCSLSAGRRSRMKGAKGDMASLEVAFYTAIGNRFVSLTSEMMLGGTRYLRNTADSLDT